MKDHIEAAISRIELTSRDHYEDISLVSTYWASDETGAKDDSELFLQTATQLQSNETQVQTWSKRSRSCSTVFTTIW